MQTQLPVPYMPACGLNFLKEKMSGNRQIVSTATAKGELILSLVENDMPTPNDDEVVVEIEAAPINPSDMFPLLVLPITQKASW